MRTLTVMYKMLGFNPKNLKELRSLNRRFPPMLKHYFKKHYSENRCRDGIIYPTQASILDFIYQQDKELAKQGLTIDDLPPELEVKVIKFEN